MDRQRDHTHRGAGIFELGPRGSVGRRNHRTFELAGTAEMTNEFEEPKLRSAPAEASFHAQDADGMRQRTGSLPVQLDAAGCRPERAPATNDRRSDSDLYGRQICGGSIEKNNLRADSGPSA
jgi:hypothetical protein